MSCSWLLSRSWLLGLCLALAPLTVSHAQEIGYVEDFSLSPNRAEALKTLIPGTEDFYYFHSLHFQQTEQFQKVDELLPAWAHKHGHTARVHEILNRQALLLYPKDPQRGLNRIRERLNLHFNHQKELLGQKPNLPTVLDEKLVTREAFFARGIAQGNLTGFEDSALDWLVSRPLDKDQRRQVLSRLQRPDYPQLVGLILADFNEENAPGFGALPIHNLLLPEQLAELVKAKPDLANNHNFVNARLLKLQPPAHVDWKHDRAEHDKYLARLWDYVSTLNPVFNSLKAHVLYQRLVFDRAGGVFDRDRFMAYIQLPRRTGYANREYLQKAEQEGRAADLSANYAGFTAFSIVGNDEPLVRAYLHQFFLKDADAKAYEPFLNDAYLRRNFAETKIVNGLGNAEQWSAMLSPEEFKALQERIDLDFAPTSKAVLGVADPVSIDLSVKNVKTLIVKVFEINTTNFLKSNLREIDTDINLDGLVANVEKTETYNEPPLRRVARHFEFPQLTKAGVYVIDFIGNGQSSRVLVRKGKLRHLVRTSTAGHVFTVLDGENKHLKDASIWLAGHQYAADKEGRITVPFSTNPGRQPLVLSHGEFSSLDTFQHEAETYQLAAGFHVDRESLLKLKKATVLIRPALSVNGTPVSLSVLEDVRLTITSTDHDGVSASKEVRDFKLLADREAVYEFQVPARLQNLSFALHATVKNLSQNGRSDVVAATGHFPLNAIDRTERTEDLFFGCTDGKYFVDVFGRTGEALPDRAIRLQFKHHDLRQPAHVLLKSNPNGRLFLGLLTDIDWVEAASPQGVVQRWTLPRDQHTQYATVHGRVGQAIEVPLPRNANLAAQATRSSLSLLERRGASFVADHFKAIKLDGGLLKVEGLAAGEYDLWLKDTNQHLTLRVGEGEPRDGYVLGKTRNLEVRDPQPLAIQSVKSDDKQLSIAVQNVSALTRVHVLASRYVPAYRPFENFGVVRDAEPYLLTLPSVETKYLSGRNIGDEYRYIIDRKYAQKFSGNTATRPSLLLNPWAIRSTQTGRQDAAAGDDFAAAGAPPPSAMARGANAAAVAGGSPGFSNLDFLSQQSAVLMNLVPDKDGNVLVPVAELGPHAFIEVVAIDQQQTASRMLTRAEPATTFQDLRLARTLDLKKHFTEQKQVSVLTAAADEKPFVIADITSSKFTAYDSLARVYGLYATLNPQPNFTEFNFILRWPTLKPAEKRELYSKYACHELNFFLFKKDQEFFATVIQPYLKNKQHKTFLDHWLLGDDVARYRQPWAYEQLNAVERILLSQRLPADAPFTRQLIGEQVAILPPNLEQAEHLYRSAVGSNALETSDHFGANAAREDALKREEQAGVPANGPANGRFGRAFGGGMGGGGGFAAGAAPAPSAAMDAGALGQGGMAGKPQTATREKQLAQSDKALAKKAAISEERKAGEKAKDSKADSLSLRRRGDANRQLSEAVERDEKADGKLGDQDRAEFESLSEDGARRLGARQLYRRLEQTMEWAENNYYRLPIEQQNAVLVTSTPFWKDYAAHPANQKFFSKHLSEAARNFTEMLFALSVLDLPFEAKEHKTTFDDAKMELAAGSSIILFHQEIKPVDFDADAPRTVLVNENFFRHNDRQRVVNGEQVDKYVTDEFLTHVVYGCQVVVTNPTSTRQKLSVLLQAPAGAIPVLNAHYTRSLPLDLQPYQTQTLEYHFYFPATGEFSHYPVQVAKNETLIAAATARLLKVVETPTTVDKQSWDYVSQHGSEADVLEFLSTQNLLQINLERMAFRLHDAAFFKKAIELLDRRHVYQHVLWSYAIQHNDPAAARQFLQHADGYLAECGAALDSALVTIDPIERRSYQHLDYTPLVNARAHQLGKRRRILNDALYQQYHRLLAILACRPQLDDTDRMAVTYYLLLQDRVDDASGFFSQVNADRMDSRLQHDYFAAYLDLFNAQPDRAKAIVAKYREHPVDRWKNAFVAIGSQLEELVVASGEGRGASETTQLAAANNAIVAEVLAVADKQPAPNNQPPAAIDPNTKLASTEPNFDFTVEAKQVRLKFQNLPSIRVNFYEMDIELLFSRNPFVQQVSGEFSFIRPNATVELKLPADKATLDFALPAKFHNSNVMVEITGAGQTKTQTYYSHALNVQVIENYGQVQVTHETSRKPLAKTYVKVYARMSDGQVKFYKDGYTDLRGRFDYSSLNTNELDVAQRFSLLILSEEHGAIVREASPPKR